MLNNNAFDFSKKIFLKCAWQPAMAENIQC